MISIRGRLRRVIQASHSRACRGWPALLADVAGATGPDGADAILGCVARRRAGCRDQGVDACLKPYRDAALKQAGKAGVTLLQRLIWPNLGS